jgi:hypothetical protein
MIDGRVSVAIPGVPSIPEVCARASKLAAQLKEVVAPFQMPGARVMSDVTGDFNRVIMEHTAESLEEFEKRMQETMGSPMGSVAVAQ